MPGQKCLQLQERGEAHLTNAFSDQIRNNVENLSNTKVSNVTEGCLKKLARAKNEMRAQTCKKSIFGEIKFGRKRFFREKPFFVFFLRNSSSKKIHFFREIIKTLKNTDL